MRIGELAALVGVTTRTVRHYHHLGLLPEPERTPGGYREYRVRDAVLLARVRRLAELGLSLDEIRDVLADDQGRELREVLTELDADLARQQDAIAARRARLAALLADADLNPDTTVAPDLGDLLHDLHPAGSAFAALDRDMISLIDTGADPAAREQVMAMFAPLTGPEARARGHALTARMDAIAGADPADPRVAVLAADLAAHLPAEMAAAMVASLDEAETGRWLDLMTSELAPAQAEVLRLMVTTLKERA
ncbi:MerR family transcriptional regulator [Catellatospora citrea]|uniref:MerR family transcriptional regulator n=1 Tax=Catellatospora citrea TaxID=53366 RepID=A0A8J3KGK8_9ACTN|nr:MerR family transcriptional regulator [Catellatospora citrea]RKE11298.1 DNA-binding transcriptional MerR regulator [Catellatospora citrea]GIF96765.1 MerR family transcriptional regulator [Catellatospora citrea]